MTFLNILSRERRSISDPSRKPKTKDADDDGSLGPGHPVYTSAADKGARPRALVKIANSQAHAYVNAFTRACVCARARARLGERNPATRWGEYTDSLKPLSLLSAATLLKAT